MQFYSIREYSHKEFGHTVKEIFDFVFLDSVTRLLLRTFPNTVNSIAVIWVKTNVNRGLNCCSWNATLFWNLLAWCAVVLSTAPTGRTWNQNGHGWGLSRADFMLNSNSPMVIPVTPGLTGSVPTMAKSPVSSCFNNLNKAAASRIRLNSIQKAWTSINNS